MRPGTANLSLRPRRPTDDGFLYRLSERLFARYSRHPAGSMASMLGEPGAQAMIAERDAVLVGFFVVGFERLGRAFGPWQRPVLGRLNAIGVRPDAQGSGVGRFLLEQAEGLAREQGAVSMSLMTAATNYRARHLFESAGYLPLLGIDDAYAGGQRGLSMSKAL